MSKNARCIPTNILIKFLIRKIMSEKGNSKPQAPQGRPKNNPGGNSPKPKANSMPRYQAPPPPPPKKK